MIDENNWAMYSVVPSMGPTVLVDRCDFMWFDPVDYESDLEWIQAVANATDLTDELGAETCMSHTYFEFEVYTLTTAAYPALRVAFDVRNRCEDVELGDIPEESFMMIDIRAGDR